jgi:hypothetical protein
MQDKSASRSLDLVLLAVGIVLGLVAALGYGAWRAVNAGASASRLGEFGGALLFPGSLIVVAITAMVWLGWKANIDG